MGRGQSWAQHSVLRSLLGLVPSMEVPSPERASLLAGEMGRHLPVVEE